VAYSMLTPLLLLLTVAPTTGRHRRAAPGITVGSVFSDAECERIVEGALEQRAEPAVLHDGSGGKVRNVLSRDGTVRWLRGSRWTWVLERMQQQIGAGEREWGVRSRGLGTDGIQVARYQPGHHYDWHTDCSPPLGGQPPSGRIISATIQLSSEHGYLGGQVGDALSCVPRGVGRPASARIALPAAAGWFVSQT
jgi:hypothetical protein